METSQVINSEKEISKNGFGKNLLKALSWYPFAWAILIMLSGLLKSHLVLMGAMMTWVIYVYAGSLTWIGLMIALPIKKRISLKEGLLYILILALGIVTSYFVVEYDFFASGVKYMD